MQQRELLDGQLNENKSVLEELNLLKEDNQVNIPLILPFYVLFFMILIEMCVYGLGVQAVRTSFGEARFRRKPAKCWQTYGLYQERAKTLQ